MQPVHKSSSHDVPDTSVHHDVITDTHVDDVIITPAAQREKSVDESTQHRTTLHSIRQSPTTVLCVVSGALFVDLLVYSIVIPVIPIFVQDNFHASTTVIGVLFAIFSIGLVIATPIFGIVSDIRSVGRRWPMLLGLAGLVACTILYGAANQLWMLFVARFFQGVSGAATWVVGFAMVADVYDADELGSKLGIVMSVNGVGLLIGPTIGGVLYTNVNYISIFIICAGVVLVDLIARIILIDETMLQSHITSQHTNNLAVLNSRTVTPARTAHNPEHVDEMVTVQVGSVTSAQLTNTETQSVTDVTTVVRPAKFGIWDMCKNVEIMVSTLAVVLVSTAFSGIEPILAIYMQAEFGFDTQITGILYLAIVVPYMISSVAAGYAADKYRNKVIMAAGMIVLGVAFSLLAISTTVWSLILSLIFLGAMFGISITPALPEISEYLQSLGHITSQAQGYALFNIAWAGGALLGGLFSGLMYDQLGWLYTLVIFGVVCGVYGIGVAFYCVYSPDVLAAHRERKRSYQAGVAAKETEDRSSSGTATSESVNTAHDTATATA